MAKNGLKSSTMFGENFEMYLSEMAKNELKLSTMVEENFEIYLSEMAKKQTKIVYHTWRKFRHLLVLND